MVIREVIESPTAPAQASVRAALDLLHSGPGGLHQLGRELSTGLSGGAADLLIDRPDRLIYSTDASIYEMEPVAIVFPRTRADIEHVVRVAARRGVPILSRGAGHQPGRADR